MEPRIFYGGTVPVNLSIKGVPDAVATALRMRAANNHRSLQRELMAIIDVAAMAPDAFSRNGASTQVAARGQRQAGRPLRPIEEIGAELDKLFPRALTRGPSSTDIIRAMRDDRYGERAATPPARRQSG